MLARTDLLPVPRDVVFVGSGRGHDAVAWAAAGHRVLGVDFAPAACRDASRKAHEAGVASRCRFEERDIFTLGAAYPAAFDAVVEYTCFCAIRPDRRVEYARNVGQSLRPAGLLVALFYPVADVTGGPPFRVRREDVEEVFLDSGAFSLVYEEAPPDSIERRRGKEWLAVLRLAR